jgi:hypothetical protein
MDNLESARKRLTDEVIARPGVTGTAIGEKGGKPCLKVYVSDRKAAGSIPGKVGGFEVVVEDTGTIRRL